MRLMLLVMMMSWQMACTALEVKEPAQIELLQVYQYDRSVQCEGPGIPPAQMAKKLKTRGIRVVGMHCGHDGLMRPQVCGGGTGKINVFDIHPDDLGKALSAGFKPLSELSHAVLRDCPPPG